MDYFSTKINQLVIEGSAVKKSFVRSFLSKPSKDLERTKGKLFGLIEIESTEPRILDLINLIIDEVKTNYYQARERGGAENEIETLFEAALQKTNLAIIAFLETEQITLDLEKINIILGVIVDKELYFTQVGNLNIFLFQYLKGNEYRIIDILEVSKTPSIPPHPLKIFSQIISGRISPWDILFLTTPDLLDYFSLEKIKNIIIDNKSIVESIAELKQLIQNLGVQNNFGIIISELQRISPTLEKSQVLLKQFDYQKAASQDSIKELIKTEKETEKFLAPSIFPEVKKYTLVLRKAFQNYLTKIKNTSIYKTKKIIPTSFKISKDLNQSWKGLQKLTTPIKKRFGDLNLPQKISPLGQKITSLISNMGSKLKTYLARLPKLSRILLVISVILATLFLLNVSWLGIKNQKAKRIEQFNQVLLEAEMKKNESEASLIYRDESQARKLLIEAKNLLTNLKLSNQTQKEQIKILLNDIENQLQDLRHIVDISEPIQIANFQNLDSQARIANLVLVINNVLYTQNHRNQSIYKANLSTRVISGIFSADSNTGNFVLGIVPNNNEIIFFNEAKKAFSLNPNNDVISELAFDISEQAKIVDVTTYNNRIYFLDKANNQIYRYSKIVSGYGNIQEWLNDNRVDLANASSLTVDGFIYVLNSDSKIIKLDNGKIVDFEMTIIDPPLQSPTKIKTTIDSDYLYILDPPTKRLVVINKKGQLINQYTSKYFDNLKDFVIAEKEKKVYLLNGSSIFGIPAEHLE